MGKRSLYLHFCIFPISFRNTYEGKEEKRDKFQNKGNYWYFALLQIYIFHLRKKRFLTLFYSEVIYFTRGGKMCSECEKKGKKEREREMPISMLLLLNTTGLP